MLGGVVVPQHLQIGTKVFGLGLGFTAYTLGVRHAFDADHIAAIDNTTRRLMADGKAAGRRSASGSPSGTPAWSSPSPPGSPSARGSSSPSPRAAPTARADLGMVGTGVSGLFLYLIGLLNLAAFVGIAGSTGARGRGLRPDGARAGAGQAAG